MTTEQSDDLWRWQIVWSDRRPPDPEVSVYDAESGLFKNGTPLTVAAAATTTDPLPGWVFAYRLPFPTRILVRH